MTYTLKVWCDWDVLREEKQFASKQDAYTHLELNWEIDEISYEILELETV